MDLERDDFEYNPLLQGLSPINLTAADLVEWQTKGKGEIRKQHNDPRYGGATSIQLFEPVPLSDKATANIPGQQRPVFWILESSDTGTLYVNPAYETGGIMQARLEKAFQDLRGRDYEA